MTSFTPGPWELTADPYPDGTPYYRFKAGDGGLDSPDDGFRFCAIISDANARLIAAAPELLEVLQALIVETVDYMTLNHLGDPETQHNVKWAREVIAKATGQ